MASQGDGDNSGGNRGQKTNLHQPVLKNPPFHTIGSNVVDSNCNSFKGWSDFPFHNNNSKHQFFPSVGYLAHFQPPWNDDLIKSPLESPTKKTSHRRSASDSLPFLEAPIDCFADVDELDCRQDVSLPLRESMDSENLEEIQPMSIFSDVEAFQKQKDQADGSTVTAPSISGSLVSLSDHNSFKDPLMLEAKLNVSSQFRSEPEDASICKGEQDDQPVKIEWSETTPPDLKVDKKRIKRIIANRQSAQRSRIRKLHYISELEESVTALEVEVSTLSPQVAFLDHRRAKLNIDNSILKERIAALVQEKIFKDEHSEALKTELQRLEQLYQQQQQMQCRQQRIEHAISSNAAFDFQQH